MSVFTGILKVIAGAALVAAGIILEILGGVAATPIAAMLISAGAGLEMNGIGTIIAGNHQNGFATTTRNPIAPWRECYGRVRTGGTLVYMHQWGGANSMLDLVIVLASHACQSVDEVLFDQGRLSIDAGAIPYPGGYYGRYAVGGTSYTPVQQQTNIASISRSNDVVTVVLNANIPALQSGDQVFIKNVSVDQTLNGKFQVADILSQTFGSPGALTFTYLNGGNPVSASGQGSVKCDWPDYGRDVYVEYLLGNQTLGETFIGMSAGTPYKGDVSNLVRPEAPGNVGGDASANPWTNYCSLMGKTAVFIRMQYDTNNFPSGLPQISFHLHGKNNIYDPRLGAVGAPGTTSYSENAALCIADYISDPKIGYGASYITPSAGTAPYNSIGIPQLITAANICDQAVVLAKGGTEPMYTCNGQFELTMKRGEVLQNLLTSCAGRLVYVGGQYTIQPAAWAGASAPQIDLKAIASGSVRWRSTVSVRDLFNGCKGTYISPDNKWQSTDFPAYAQDTLHGYSGPSQYGGDINMAEDGGIRRWYDIHLPFTISCPTAQRIAKIEMLRRRQQGTGVFACSLAGLQFEPLDVIEASHSILNWSEKYLEIAAVRFRAAKQGTEACDVMSLSTEVDVQETDPDIYNWTTTEELTPQGYVQPQLPGGVAASENLCLPWSPGYVAPLPGDAYQGQGSFGLQPVYAMDTQGNWGINLQVKGTPPINDLDTEITGPAITCTGSASGGTLGPGLYAVGLSGFDVSGENLDYADFGVVLIPAGGTGSIAVNISWPGPGGGGELYVALLTPLLQYQYGTVIENWPVDIQWANTWHLNQPITVGQSTATVSAMNLTSRGGPDPMFYRFAVAWQKVVHAGVWAQQVQAVTHNTVTIAGTGMTANLWAGYVVSLLAKYNASVEVPILHMPVSGSSASSGGLFTLTIGPNSAGVQLPDLTTLLSVGDLLVMRGKYTFTAKSFSDPNVANVYYPGGASGVEAGHLAIVMTGQDAGDVQTISSVSGTNDITFNIAGNWVITPATGDLVIIIDPSQAQEFPSAPYTQSNAAVTGVVAQPSVPNMANQTWLITVRTEDAKGNHGPDWIAPQRELYLFGAGENVVFWTA